MKQLLPLLFALMLLSSCNKGDKTYPIIEEVTTGSKWGIHIGNNAADVYTQVQALGQEKQFTEVELVGQSTFDRPAAIGERVILYSGISFEEKDNVYPNRVIIRFRVEKYLIFLPADRCQMPPPAGPQLLLTIKPFCKTSHWIIFMISYKPLTHPAHWKDTPFDWALNYYRNLMTPGWQLLNAGILHLPMARATPL